MLRKLDETTERDEIWQVAISRAVIQNDFVVSSLSETLRKLRHETYVFSQDTLKRNAVLQVHTSSYVCTCIRYFQLVLRRGVDLLRNEVLRYHPLTESAASTPRNSMSASSRSSDKRLTFGALAKAKVCVHLVVFAFFLVQWWDSVLCGLSYSSCCCHGSGGVYVEVLGGTLGVGFMDKRKAHVM